MTDAKSVMLELDLEEVALLRDLCLRFKRLEEKLPDGDFLAPALTLTVPLTVRKWLE